MNKENAVLSKKHDVFQRFIESELKRNGYIVIDQFLYYKWLHTLNDRIKNLFRSSNCLEVLFLRTLPDLLAIKEDGKKCLLLEIKSFPSEYENIAIELYPFIINYVLSLTGIAVYYVIQYPHSGCDRSNYLCIPPRGMVEFIDEIYLVEKYGSEFSDHLRTLCKNLLGIPDIKFKERTVKDIRRRKTKSENVGSGDPFFLIRREGIQEMHKKYKNFSPW